MAHMPISLGESPLCCVLWRSRLGNGSISRGPLVRHVNPSPRGDVVRSLVSFCSFWAAKYEQDMVLTPTVLDICGLSCVLTPRVCLTIALEALVNLMLGGSRVRSLRFAGACTHSALSKAPGGASDNSPRTPRLRRTEVPVHPTSASLNRSYKFTGILE